MKPASRKPVRDLAPEHLPVAAEVVRDVRPGAGRDEPRRQRIASQAEWCWWPVSASCACSRASSSSVRGDEDAGEQPHEHDQHDPADELGERELPADQHPEHEPELPHEIGRGELEGQRGARRRALLEERLRDRDRGIRARRGGRAERGRPSDLTRALARERALDRRARHPGLDDRGDREAEHERPPHLVRHEERVLEPLADVGHNPASRPTRSPSR